MARDRIKAAHRPVTLGRISGLHGVRGWVTVFSYTEPRAALLDYKEWLVGLPGAWTTATVAEGREQGKTLVVRLEGTRDRASAARCVGAEIAVTRDSLPAAGPGEYYWADLEGLEVRHRDGRILGRVARLLATGAHDVMVVRSGGEEGGEVEREVLIPFVLDRYVLDVDLDQQVIDVDWEWD
ncbi:MAG: ribosome maturation factor RimM [Woeseiaceae bacterium]